MDETIATSEKWRRKIGVRPVRRMHPESDRMNYEAGGGDMVEEKKIHRASVVDTGKALARQGGGRELREGEKPSAPANLVLPKPVKIPVAPAKKSDKE
jgi:hypothetical protein